MSIREQILRHAEQLAQAAPGMREHWFAIGALYLQVEREWMEQNPSKPRPTGKALGKVRREASVTPEELGLGSNEVSAAVTLARWRKAVEVFLHCNASKVSSPVQWVTDWKRWAVQIRTNEGGGKFTREVKEKYFPGIPDNEFRYLFPPAKADPDTLRKIVKAANLAEDQADTPEGERARETAEELADSLGLTVEEAREQYEEEPSALEHERLVRATIERVMALSKTYPIALYKAAALYMLDNGAGDRKHIEALMSRLNQEEE